MKFVCRPPFLKSIYEYYIIVDFDRVWNGEKQVSDELNIIERVMAAQNDIKAADSLIREYIPFIKKETAKTIGRIPVEGKDDELSIALMGFHEAIESYNPEKGAFIKFASIVIKRRLLDFLRHENRFKKENYFDESVIKNEECYLEEASSDIIVERETLKEEIAQLSKNLEQLDITISEVAENCPKQEKTIIKCRQAVNYICERPELVKPLLQSGKLPLKHLVEETSIKKKTLERHRKYIIALIVVYSCGYDSMINYLSEVFKFQKGGK